MKKKTIYIVLVLCIIAIAILYKFNLLNGDLKSFALSFTLAGIFIVLVLEINDYIKKKKKRITGGNKR